MTERELAGDRRERHRRQRVGVGNGRAELPADAAVLQRPPAAGVQPGDDGSGSAIDDPANVVEDRADDQRAAVDGDRRAELVVCRPFGGVELGHLRPGCAGLDEDIGRSLIGEGAHVVVGRADGHRVARDGDRGAETIVGGAAVGVEPCLLDPRCSAPGEDVHRALIGVRAHVVEVGAHDHGPARDGDRDAELVAGRSVGGVERGLLRPRDSGAREDMGRSLVGDVARAHVVEERADDRRVARDGDRDAEAIVGRARGGGKAGLLRPRDSRAGEDVGRALIDVGAHVVELNADDHRVAGDGDREAELVVGRSVRGVEPGLLGPRRAGPHEHVGRALIAVGPHVVAARAHDHGVAVDGHRLTEEVARGSVRGVESRLENPSRSGADEDVHRPLVEVPVHVVAGGAHDRGVAIDRDGHAELVATVRQRGGESGDLRPGRAAAVEDVRRALIGVGAHVVEGGPDERRVAVDGDRPAEAVAAGSVGGDEPDLLRPGRAVTDEDIRRALIGGGVHVGGECADDHGVAGDGHGDAEAIVGRAACGVEPGLLGPRGPAPREDIGRALVGVGAHVVPVGSDDHRVARDGDGDAELVVGGAVRGVDRGLLRPDRAVAGEDEGRTLVGVRAQIVEVRSDDDRVARDRDRDAELVAARAGGGVELALQGPRDAGSREDVRRALIDVEPHVVLIGSDDDRVARDRDRGAEPVGGRPGGHDESGLLGPRGAGPDEDVGRALVVVEPHVIEGGADDQRVAFDGHRLAEEVVGGSVGGVEAGLQGPVQSRATEDEDRSLVDVPVDVMAGSSDDRGVAADGHRGAEEIVRADAREAEERLERLTHLEPGGPCVDAEGVGSLSGPFARDLHEVALARLSHETNPPVLGEAAAEGSVVRSGRDDRPSRRVVDGDLGVERRGRGLVGRVGQDAHEVGRGGREAVVVLVGRRHRRVDAAGETGLPRGIDREVRDRRIERAVQHRTLLETFGMADARAGVPQSERASHGAKEE